MPSAASRNAAETHAAAGAQGMGTAVGGAMAIGYVENDTVARIGSGAGGSITLNGDLGAVASHSDKVLTTATGEAAGKGTGVGIALGLNIIQDDTQAEVARGFTGAHNVDVEATSLLTASVESRASVAGSSTKDSKGGDSRDSDQESKAQSDFVNDKSGSSSKAEPTQNTGSSLNTANSNTEKQSGNSSDSGGGTSVAASVAVNYLDAKNAAKIADNVTIVARRMARSPARSLPLCTISMPRLQLSHRQVIWLSGRAVWPPLMWPMVSASASSTTSLSMRPDPGMDGPPAPGAVGTATATGPNARMRGPAVVSTVCTRACGTICQRRHSQPRAT